jgi:hypothetical protein
VGQVRALLGGAETATRAMVSPYVAPAAQSRPPEPLETA